MPENSAKVDHSRFSANGYALSHSVRDAVGVLPIHPGRLHRVIQEVRSIFWETILWVIVRKKVHMNVRIILKGYRDRAV